MTGASDYAGLLGGSGDIVYNDDASDNVNLTANTVATITGTGGDIGLLGSGDNVTASNETINTVANTQGENLTGTGDIVNGSNNLSINIGGGYDTVNLASSGDTLGLLGGSVYTVTGDVSSDVVNMLGNVGATVTGSGGGVYLGGSGDNVSTSNETIGTAANDQNESVTGTGDTIFETANNAFNVSGGSDTVDMTGANDYAGLLSGSGDVVYNDNASDQVNLAGATSSSIDGSGGSVTLNGSGGSSWVSGIDAVYNAVLDRDMTPAELTSAEALLATGTSLNGLQAQLASSAEARSDMASSYAAASGSYQALLNAQPQSNYEVPSGGGTPSQTEFNAFADAMSTSYGAPIEVFSVDPLNGTQTELADTSMTNLLAELPVLETEADGVNLGLQLADGTQVQFASTAGLATFLYSLAVQQMQATSFVTDNYNLDLQWLNTVDQPLLEEAEFWSERATAEASAYPERAIEDNTQASMALQIAAETPSSRHDMSVTIHNASTGNPTQITVFAAGDGSTIHDVSGGIGSYIESALSTVLNIAAVVSGQAYLYFAAAAMDAAEAGQAFSNGEDIQGIISLAQAVSAGITGGAGGTSPTTPAPVTAQVINAAAQGVGGVYGIVQSAENGNAVGILAGALEAAAAGAAGIGIAYGGSTQTTLNAIAAALGTAGIATNMGSDFASGNVGQGLVDSLNLYLPAVAQAYVNSSNNISASLGWAGQNTTVTAAASGGLTNFDATIGSNAIGGVVTQDGETYVVAADQSQSGSDNATITLSSITDWFVGGVLGGMRFLGSEAAQLLDLTVPAETSARTMTPEQAQFVDNNGNPILNSQGQPMMMPAAANPAAITDIGSSLAQAAVDPSGESAGSGNLAIADLALFRQGGAWDFQRVGPSAQNVTAFQDYANVMIGAYAASIGMSLNDVLSISNQYASMFSKFDPTAVLDPVYTSLRRANVQDETIGYSLYQNGLIGHH